MTPLTILCLASYEKGHDFLRACKQQGCRVLLLTSLSLKDSARWPREALDDIFYMPDENKQWDHNQTIFAISHLARTERIVISGTNSRCACAARKAVCACRPSSIS